MANLVIGADGELLEYRRLMANPKTRAVWSHSYAGEYTNTNTTVFIHHPFQFINNPSISSSSCPIYAMFVSCEIEGDQGYLNDDGLSPEELQRAKDEQEAAVVVRKQVEADLARFDMEQE
jgi:hypothetical protein